MANTVLDRDLETVWLDAALRVARQRLPIPQGREQLRHSLECAPLGEAAFKKTITALTRIWLQPVDQRAGHALWALEHADRSADWRPLHLGVLLAHEPFIRSLLEACGLEQRAKGEIDTVALRRRMRNVYGPKRTIDVATQRGVKTLRSLGALEGDPQVSISRGGRLTVEDPALGSWIVRCLLLGRHAESIAVEDLGHAPELFGVRLPSALPRSAAGVSKHTEGVGRTVLALDR